MVEMLNTATQEKKIHWEEQNDDFSTKIGGCTVELMPSYDYQANVSSYHLKLYNREDVAFETFSYSDDVDTDEYQRLNELYANIRDVNYKITESEKIILDSLRALTEPFESGEALPF